MIDIRAYTIGEKEIAETLAKAPERLRLRLIERLAEVGERIVADAKSAAPVGKHHKGPGPTLRDAIHYLIRPVGASLQMKVTPYSRGQLLGHIIERGVEDKQIRVYRKAYKEKVYKSGRSRKLRVRNKSTFLYTRMHHIAPHPFFYPAVQRAGDLGPTLQDAVSQAAADLNAGGR